MCYNAAEGQLMEVNYRQHEVLELNKPAHRSQAEKTWCLRSWPAGAATHYLLPSDWNSDSHGGAEARREQREESLTGHRGTRAIGVSRALACHVKTPGAVMVANRCFSTCPSHHHGVPDAAR
jgi:hypothetical protein